MNKWKKAKRHIPGVKSSTHAAASPTVPVNEEKGSDQSSLLWPTTWLMIEALQQVSLQKDDFGLNLGPGRVVSFPKDTAKVLLDELGDKVRVIGEVISESDGYSMSGLYWVRANGMIAGPGALVDHLLSEGPEGAWFLLMNCDEQLVWVHGSAMRTRQQYEEQGVLRELELEPKNVEEL